jgi:hypothetical protein
MATPAPAAEATWFELSNCEALVCIPIVGRNRVEWWDRHYLMPGIHVAKSRDGITRGIEFSYFRAIGLGGIGVLAASDETPKGRRAAFGVGLFLTYVGVDFVRSSEDFTFERGNRWHARPMATIGWVSLYYQPGHERQIGLLLKAPIRFSE